jgi:hypothetical protein
VRVESLLDITPSDVVKEGFPGLSPDDFRIEVYREPWYTLVRRIEFEYVEAAWKGEA